MTSDAESTSDRQRSASTADAFRNVDAHIPPVRGEWIVRPRLLNRIATGVRGSVLLVAAPAGYGKTTAVTQWATSSTTGSVAWVTLSPADSNPTRFWSHLATALEIAGCTVDSTVAEHMATGPPGITGMVVPQLAAALAAHPTTLTMVLDDCHVLRGQAYSDQLNQLINLLPGSVRLILISRADPPVRLSRLRVEGRLAEVRANDLAFDHGEVEAVLLAAGVSLTGSELRRLVDRTEGWPAAIYLAALSLAGRDDAGDFVRVLNGSSRFVADYLSEEVFTRQDAELRAFILAMSVFDRFNVALANFATSTHTASRLLYRLERANLFLSPLGDGWFRFHQLFATYAQSALETEHPDSAAELHRRGAQWFGTHGHTEDAVDHLLAAGDFDEAAAMIQGNWLRYFEGGRGKTVLGWLDRLTATPAADAAPATVTAAWMAALTGDRVELQRRLTNLEILADSPLPDGTRSPGSALMLIRGLFGFDGPDRMLADARRAVELETGWRSPWPAVACAALGHAAFVTGDLALARAQLTQAASATTVPLTVRVLALGTLSLCEAEQGNHSLSAQLAADAMDIVTQHRLQAMPQAILAFTAHGASLAAGGHLVEASELLECGLIARQAPGLSPWPLIHHLLVTASVAARSGDSLHANQLLDEVDQLVVWQDETVHVTRRRVASVRRLVGARPPAQPTPGAALTPRELQVLRRLRGTQSLREIANDLYVSHNTIKTITLSVYRKLGVHSRAEAKAIARNIDRS